MGMRLCLLTGFLAAAFTVFGQTSVPAANTVTATVSTVRSASAGTATFQVQILDASLNASVDSAIALGASSGASAANLAGVSASISQGLIVSRYDFNMVVPASEYAGTRDKLLAAQRGLAASNSQAIGWTVSYSVSDSELAGGLEAVLPGLLERARKQADTLAGAIGRSVDQVVNLGVPSLSNSGLQVFATVSVTYGLKPL